VFALGRAVRTARRALTTQSKQNVRYHTPVGRASHSRPALTTLWQRKTLAFDFIPVTYDSIMFDTFFTTALEKSAFVKSRLLF